MDTSSSPFLERFDKEDEKFEYDAAVKDHLDTNKIPEIMRNDVVRIFRFFRFVRISCTVSIGAAIILVRDENISTVEKLARRVGKGSVRLEGLAGLDDDDCEKIIEQLSKNCPNFFDKSLVPSSSSSSSSSNAGMGGDSAAAAAAASGGVGDTGAVRVRKSPLSSHQRIADAAAAAAGGMSNTQISSSSSSGSHQHGGSNGGGSVKQSSTELKKVSSKTTTHSTSRPMASATANSSKKSVMAPSQPALPVVMIPNSHRCDIKHPRAKPNDFLIVGGSEG